MDPMSHTCKPMMNGNVLVKRILATVPYDLVEEPYWSTNQARIAHTLYIRSLTQAKAAIVKHKTINDRVNRLAVSRTQAKQTANENNTHVFPNPRLNDKMESV